LTFNILVFNCPLSTAHCSLSQKIFATKNSFAVFSYQSGGMGKGRKVRAKDELDAPLLFQIEHDI
jgi:hypothetical protein